METLAAKKTQSHDTLALAIDAALDDTLQRFGLRLAAYRVLAEQRRQTGSLPLDATTVIETPDAAFADLGELEAGRTQLTFALDPEMRDAIDDYLGSHPDVDILEFIHQAIEDSLAGMKRRARRARMTA